MSSEEHLQRLKQIGILVDDVSLFPVPLTAPPRPPLSPPAPSSSSSSSSSFSLPYSSSLLAPSALFVPSQLVLIGFGMVCRTMLTIMLKTGSRLLSLPILVIEPKKIIPRQQKRGKEHEKKETKKERGCDECPVSCKFENDNDEHEPETLHSEAFAALLSLNPNVTVLQTALTRENYEQLFAQHVQNNAIVVELAVRLGTASLIQECQRRHCVYVNTAIDSWEYVEDSLFSVKQSIIAEVKYDDGVPRMTAACNHGMNPGLVSHFVKHLLSQLAKQSPDKRLDAWQRAGQYNYIAKELGLTLIQIAERDCQTTRFLSTEKCFFNTWSVVGLIDEATMDTEISWGTHEREMPYAASKREKKASTQIILPVPGYQVRTQSYEPKGGPFTGYCIPHAEAYSIAQYLRVDNKYNPSVYYSYLLSDTAKLLTHYLDYALNKEYLPKREHVLRSDEIQQGYDSVGVLMFFRQQQPRLRDTQKQQPHETQSEEKKEKKEEAQKEQQKKEENALKKYWVGSIVDNEMAKAISPEINATCAQVAISVLACVEWMLLNPHRGIIEPEFVDSEFILDYCREWLGEFYVADVTEDCKIESDQLEDLLKSPNYILFE